MAIEIGEDGTVRRVPVPGVVEAQQVIEAAIREAADELDGEVIAYSGRFMYGTTCIAVVVDSSRDFVERAAVLATVNGTLGAGEALLAGAEIDNYASSHVVYWPDLVNG